MPFANQGDDCETRGSWHSGSIGSYRDRAFKGLLFSNNSFQQPFHGSGYYHESPASHSSALAQYYGAYQDSKNGVLPDSHSQLAFRHSQPRSLRVRNVSERQNVEPAPARPRIGSVRRDYDIDDVFCPSYVDRDAAKTRSQQNNSSPSVALAGEFGKSADKNKSPKGLLQRNLEFDREVSRAFDTPSNFSYEDDNGKVANYSSCVDTEAERALLLSMGWKEAAEDDDCEGNISQQEIDEFYRLLRSSSNQAGRFTSSRIRRMSDQTSSTPALSTGSTPAQPEVFDDKCMSDDGLSSDDSLSDEDN